MLFYIRAKVEVKIDGISGLFGETKSYLVHGDHVQMAKARFEAQVKAEKRHMQPREVMFTYQEIAQEI